MKKYNLCLILPIKCFNDKIKQIIYFFYEMNPILVFYHGKIVQQSDAVNWPTQPIQLETKKIKTSQY